MSKPLYTEADVRSVGDALTEFLVGLGLPPTMIRPYAAAVPIMDALTADGWRKLPTIAVGDRVGFMFESPLNGTATRIEGVVIDVYVDGMVSAEFEQRFVSPGAAMALPPMVVTAPTGDFVRSVPAASPSTGEDRQP